MKIVSFEANDISENSILLLAENNPNIMKLELFDDYSDSLTYSDVHVLQYFAKFCPQLEDLSVACCTTPYDAILCLAESCHQLKCIRINSDNVANIAPLLKQSTCLEVLRFWSYCDNPGEVITTLGQCCSLLHTLDFCCTDENVNINPVMDNQIEIFTKGCRCLKELSADRSFKGKCNKLYQCLGTYNPNLEILKNKSRKL